MSLESAVDAFPTDELVDRFALLEVLNRYFYGLDARDIDLVMTCFTQDVVLRFADGANVMHGLDTARRHFAEKRGYAALGIDVQASTHSLGNVHLTFSSEGAHAVTHAVATLSGHVAGEKVLMQRGIVYTDKFVHADGGWRIRDRLHVAAWHHVCPDHAA
jgi:ketosteroid isomerase-like protein